MVQKGAHLCGFSSETTHQVDQCPTPPRMHFFPVVMGVWWGRDAARRLGPGTHTHSPAPIFPTCNLAPLSALVQMRWSGRWTDAVSKLHIQKTATQRSRNNVSLAWKEHKLVLLFFFPRVNINIVVFSSLQVLTGSCHIIAILSGPTRPWSGHRGIGLLPAPSARLGSHQGKQPIFSLFLSEKYLIIIP